MKERADHPVSHLMRVAWCGFRVSSGVGQGWYGYSICTEDGLLGMLFLFLYGYQAD